MSPRGLTIKAQARGADDVNREAELERPSRVAWSDWLGRIIVILSFSGLIATASHPNRLGANTRRPENAPERRILERRLYQMGDKRAQ